AMDRPLLFGADGFRYPEPLCYQEHDLKQELDLVAVTRRQMARTLKLVASDAWQRTAVHSETGLVTLRQLLLHAINHLRHHLRFVAEKRAAMATNDLRTTRELSHLENISSLDDLPVNRLDPRSVDNDEFVAETAVIRKQRADG